jgi:fermentation-respiration switch protein FrsA (DUF1100 family)
MVSECVTPHAAQSGPRVTEETRPLLTRPVADSARPTTAWHGRWPIIVVLLVSLVLFSHSMAGSLAATPLVRLLEDSICRSYYYSDYPSDVDRPPLEEKQCKIDTIQTRLAYFNSWVSMTEAVLCKPKSLTTR